MIVNLIDKMAFYEHTFIGKQDLSDKEVDSLITKYSNIITFSEFSVPIFNF